MDHPWDSVGMIFEINRIELVAQPLCRHDRHGTESLVLQSIKLNTNAMIVKHRKNWLRSLCRTGSCIDSLKIIAATIVATIIKIEIPCSHSRII